jgi:hypothetical protein
MLSLPNGKWTDDFAAMFHHGDELARTTGRCFKHFPGECDDCDHYVESVQKSLWLFEVVYQGFSPQLPMVTITRECILYHKKEQEGIT